jgi:hypothetical protein
MYLDRSGYIMVGTNDKKVHPLLSVPPPSLFYPLPRKPAGEEEKSERGGRRLYKTKTYLTKDGYTYLAGTNINKLITESPPLSFFL